MSIAEMVRNRNDGRESGETAEVAWDNEDAEKKLAGMTRTTRNLSVTSMRWLMPSWSAVRLHWSMTMNHCHWNWVVAGALTTVIYFLHLNQQRCPYAEVNDDLDCCYERCSILHVPSLVYHNDPYRRRNHQHCQFHLRHSTDHRQRN